MPEIILFGDIVEENGKTIRENNLEKKHNIPLGTLVEVKYSNWHGDGCCEKVHARLWVVYQGRDCDGTPLYWLSTMKPDNEVFLAFKDQPLLGSFVMHGGYAEEDLTVVPVTEDLKQGEGSLHWKDQDDEVGQ